MHNFAHEEIKVGEINRVSKLRLGPVGWRCHATSGEEGEVEGLTRCKTEAADVTIGASSHSRIWRVLASGNIWGFTFLFNSTVCLQLLFPACPAGEKCLPRLSCSQRCSDLFYAGPAVQCCSAAVPGERPGLQSPLCSAPILCLQSVCCSSRSNPQVQTNHCILAKLMSAVCTWNLQRNVIPGHIRLLLDINYYP